jgi:hypothetical protein
MSINELHSENADVPILDTLSAKPTVDNLQQLENAPLPIYVIPSSIVASVIL